jgi:putative ABC transport system permease protein
VPDIIPRLKEMDIDYRVLGFTLGVSVLTGILFGLVPALKASKPDLVNELKEGSRTGSGTGSQRARSVLLVAEMALALVLSIGAALLARSFVQLTAVDPGFKADHLLTFTLNLPDAKYSDNDTRRTFYDSLVRKLESLPGAGAAGAISVLPMRGLLLNMRTYVWPFQVDGLPAAQRGQEPVADFRVVTHGLFEAFEVPLRHGRRFTEQDTRDAEPVVIINEALARRYFKGEDPIGKRLNLGINDQTMRQIVGVVGDIKLNGLGSEPEPAIYAPLRQYSWKTMSLVIRTSIDPEALGTAARSAIRALDPDLPVSNLAPMDQVISDSLLPHWLSMYLLGTFAALALLLAVVGIYGLTAYSVGQRRHEIGLRMALGARRPNILRLVLTHGLLVSATGVTCGLPLAYAVSGVLRGLLFGVTASDPAVFVSVPLLLIAVSALASLIPADRASRVDPIVALRHE